MLSNLTIAGMVTALTVCLLLVIVPCIIYHKHKGNSGGTFFVVVLGVAAAVLTSQLASMLGGVLGLNALAEEHYLLALAIFALLVAGVDIAIRLYSASYMNKTGIGIHKGIALGAGYIIGQQLSQIMLLFMHLVYAVAINAGTFIDESQTGVEGYEEAAAFQQTLINLPAGTYFSQAAEYLAMAVLQAVLVLWLVRGVLEEKKATTAISIAAVRFAYELGNSLISAFSTEAGGALYTESVQLIVRAVFSVAVIIIGILALKKIVTDFPQGREQLVKSRSQMIKDTEDRQKRLAWQEVSRLNTRSIVRPEENAAEAGDSTATGVKVEEKCGTEAVETAETGELSGTEAAKTAETENSAMNEAEQDKATQA